MCRKFGLEPVVLRNGGSSVKDAESRGAIVPAVKTPPLYAAIVCALLVPSK